MSSTTSTTEATVAEGTPDLPANPTAAQIPLQTFDIPTLPKPILSSLLSLTLTSDIKPVDYGTLLSTPLTPFPELPENLEALSLELFSLGWPRGWLSKLKDRISGGRPGKTGALRQLTIWNCLIDGVDGDSEKDGDGVPIDGTGSSISTRKDAATFLRDILVDGVRRLHILDSFCRRSFYSSVGDSVFHHLPSGSSTAGSLHFLEISYTYRGHSDPQFLARLPGRELHALIQPSCIGVSLSLEAPPVPPQDVEESDNDKDSDLPPSDPADIDHTTGQKIPGRKPEGIVPLGIGEADSVIKRLTGEDEVSLPDPRGDNAPETGTAEISETTDTKIPVSKPHLKMLDLTLYTLTPSQLEQLLTAQPELRVLSVCVLADEDRPADSKEKAPTTLGDKDPIKTWLQILLTHILPKAPSLEVVDIVAVPSDSDAWKEHQSLALDNKTEKKNSEADLETSPYPKAAELQSVRSKHLSRLSEVRVSVLRTVTGVGKVQYLWDEGKDVWKAEWVRR